MTPARPVHTQGAVVGGIRRSLAGLDETLRRFEGWSRSHFSVVACGILALAIANELKIYGLHPTEWDVLYMSSVVVLTVGVRFGLALPERVAKTVEQLHNRGSLTGNPESLASAVVSRGDSWAHEGGLALAVVVAVSFSIAFWQIFPDQILFTIIATLAAYLVGRLISRLVAIGTLGSMVSGGSEWDVRPNPFHPDGAAGLKPIGELYVRQASVLLIPGVFVAGWWVLIPIVDSFNHYERWRTPYLGLLCLTVVLQVLAFVLPMISFHRLMRAAKQERLADADRRVSPELARIEEVLAFTQDARERADLKERSSLLRDYSLAINEMPTWPVDITIRRRFTLNNSLLLVPLLGRAVGLSSFWSDLANRLHEIFGNVSS